MGGCIVVVIAGDLYVAKNYTVSHNVYNGKYTYIENKRLCLMMTSQFYHYILIWSE